MSDFNTSDRDVDRAIRSWLHEDRHEDVSRVAGAVLDQVDTLPQRRPWWPAWRTPLMNKFVPIGLGAAAVVVALVVGMQFLPTAPGDIGTAPSAAPAPTPTATAAAPSASAAAASTPAPLTQSFTSPLHGISLSYPEDWTAKAATEPWTGTGGPHFPDPFADLLIDPVLGDSLFLVLGSQPIGSSTPDEWVAETMAADECTVTQPFAVDGATGLIGDCGTVAVTAAGRGYRIRLYASGDDLVAVAPYGRAWFESVLATVQLHPEDAVDVVPQATAAAPSASAATAPTPPPLRASFTSTQHGISVSYPEGWTARPASEPWTDRPGVPQFLHPGFDVLQDPLGQGSGELFLWITSRPIGDITPKDWVATMMAAWECTSTEPIAVDGATGLIGATGCHELAAVATAGRGYEIGLYHGRTGERLADSTYTRAWFEEVLATVQLHPEDAVDVAPSATP